MAGKAVIFAFMILSSIAMMTVQSQEDEFDIQPVGQGQYAGPGYEYLSQRQLEKDFETPDFSASPSQAESGQAKDAPFRKFLAKMSPCIRVGTGYLAKKAEAFLSGRPTRNRNRFE